MTEKTPISISGRGIAYGKFDTATYSVTIRGKGKTGPKAKASARKVQTDLFNRLKQLEAEGVTMVPGKTRSSLSIDKDYRQSIFSGYIANFNLTFRSRDLDRMGEIHDSLTSIEGAEVASPTFLLDPDYKEELRREAFKKAAAQATQRFVEQCEILGLNPENYVVESWDQHEGRHTGGNFKALSNWNPMSNDEDFFLPDRANVEPGESRVELTVTLDFVER